MNYILYVAIACMVLAQIAKLITVYIVEKRWNFGVMISTGGMPSSHTALVTTLTISIWLVEGIASTQFAISAVLAMIVIHDSMGVRYEAGKHASVLNELVEDIKHITSKETPTEERLQELLGHKPIEVAAGFGFGVAFSVLCYLLIYPMF